MAHYMIHKNFFWLLLTAVASTVCRSRLGRLFILPDDSILAFHFGFSFALCLCQMTPSWLSCGSTTPHLVIIIRQLFILILNVDELGVL